MTLIEQACHQGATQLWVSRPDIADAGGRMFLHLSRVWEASSVQPTSSASAVLLRGMAAVGAEVYRAQAPTLSAWKNTIADEPELLRRKASEFLAGAGDELRLHREILGRLVRGASLRPRHRSA
jgi:hypothetical protein